VPAPNPMMRDDAESRPLFQRVGEGGRAVVRLHVDDAPIEALEGDTLLVALLTNGSKLRTSEFGDGPRTGFCLMGACQDCWVWTAAGARLRACGTPVAEGMRIVTREVPWPTPA
jgi:NADH dehydrogenase/NADH:ubiquinone oxidoreductase subunit G